MGSEEKEPFLRAPISNPARGGPAQATWNGSRPSPPEPELGDNRPVALDVRPLQIVEQAPPLPDQL